MLLFEQAEVPKAHESANLADQSTWLTWGKDFRNEHRSFSTQLNRIGAVTAINLSAYQCDTYTINLAKLDKGFLRDFKLFTAALACYQPGDAQVFFCNLLCRKINGKLLHFLFATFRAVIVADRKDKMAALHIPLVRGKKISDLPLHCDLFMPEILLNVFEKVAKDDSGKSTFLKLDQFLNGILPKITLMPVAVKLKITEILVTVTKKDRYQELVNLLYNERHPWNLELLDLLEQHKQKILFARGEGYLINDRKWLHGRDQTNGGIFKRRLHRLAFQCANL